MKQVISKNKKVLVFHCKDCYTKFKTDEWEKKSEANKIASVESDCPGCGSKVITCL